MVTELHLCRDVYHCLGWMLDLEDWDRLRDHMMVMHYEAKYGKKDKAKGVSFKD
ncbi:MAG TPA: hypothetical protein VMW24_24795 [Sedimentisphaerales bacterium]|nr:hypothetical protein [Sedimentisphaerales bacterium]